MRVAELVASRQANWCELEQLCDQLERRRKKRLPGSSIARFAALYRAACADLALADAYQLPSDTVYYLHQLVGQAHNQLYRGRQFKVRDWGREMIVAVPRRLFRDGSLRLALVIFWGFFFVSAYLASGASPLPDYAKTALGEAYAVQLEETYSEPVGQGDGQAGRRGLMAGFYISHNTAIGLRCFAAGLLFGVGGLFATTFNAFYLGAAFGYMTTVPQGVHFFEFVTAHAPFELSAVVLSAAAGMRLGFSLVATDGHTRIDALRLAARQAMPTMGTAIVLFALAALIEGFVSASPLSLNVKQAVAATSCGLLLFYFLVLGYPSVRSEG
ncbi:MAG: stage II sporulation protein M [Planctomycetia bacterium]|nr:MAG: stage II sporulation protein M [Planctomycetia bacterium]